MLTMLYVNYMSLSGIKDHLRINGAANKTASELEVQLYFQGLLIRPRKEEREQKLAPLYFKNRWSRRIGRTQKVSNFVHTVYTSFLLSFQSWQVLNSSIVGGALTWFGTYGSSNIWMWKIVILKWNQNDSVHWRAKVVSTKSKKGILHLAKNIS